VLDFQRESSAHDEMPTLPEVKVDLFSIPRQRFDIVQSINLFSSKRLIAETNR
jgi:hypothetical protein